MSTHNDQPTGKQRSILGLLSRLFWMLFGNAVLFFSVVFIFEHKNGLFHTADVVFWITVAALLIVRYLDINLLDGLTATGYPASMAHWRRYIIWLLVCSTALWLISHIVNYFLILR
jgi:bacteriorhodopsin